MNNNVTNEQIKKAKEKQYNLHKQKRTNAIKITAGSAVLAMIVGAGGIVIHNINKKETDDSLISSSTSSSISSTIKPGVSTPSSSSTSSSSITSSKPVSSTGTSSSTSSVPVEGNKPVSSTNGNTLGNLGVELETPKKDTTTTSSSTSTSTNNKPVGTVTDNKNGTLEVKPNGSVTEKEPSYEIKDKDGNVVEEGKLDNTNKIPDGWAYDSVLNKYLPKEEVGKYVKDDEGLVWLKSDYEAYLEERKKYENNKGEVIESTIIGVDGSTTNSDSYYLDSLSGLKFESKADWEQWVLQDYEGYGIVNGIMKPQTKEMDDALNNYNNKAR